LVLLVLLVLQRSKECVHHSPLPSGVVKQDCEDLVLRAEVSPAQECTREQALEVQALTAVEARRVKCHQVEVLAGVEQSGLTGVMAGRVSRDEQLVGSYSIGQGTQPSLPEGNLKGNRIWRLAAWISNGALLLSDEILCINTSR
jgi:hypothetical protein